MASTVLGGCISRAKVLPALAPQYRQHALISDILDLVHLSLRELDRGPTQWVEATEPCVVQQGRPIKRHFTEKSDCKRPLRIEQVRILGAQGELILRGTHRHLH